MNDNAEFYLQLRIAGAARRYPMPNGYDEKLFTLHRQDFENRFGLTASVCLVRDEANQVAAFAHAAGLIVVVSDAVKAGNFMLQGVRVVPRRTPVIE